MQDLEDLRVRFKAAFERLGWDVSAGTYDRKRSPIDDPHRRTGSRCIGTWDKVKAWASGGEWEESKEQKKEEIESPDTATTFKSILNENRRLTNNLRKAQDVSDTIINCCLTEIAKMNIKPVAIPPRQSATENLDFVSLRSDAQVGQYTDPKWTQGISEYNAAIYQQRVNRLAEKIATFREQDHRSLGLNKLTVYHLGDQVEGEAIFGGQAFSIDLSGVAQLFHSVEVESNFLLFLASIFPEVEVFCVPGNHGRPAMKGMNHPKTNFDYIFYRILQMTLEKQENIKIYVSESPSMVVQQGNFNCVLNHGDNAKGWGGIPFYGLDRVSRRVHELYGMIIDYNYCGHHHTPANLADRTIMNGCLPGGSDLSVNKMALATKPSQKIFYFHKKNGINRESNLYLADPVKLEADNNGIYTAYV